jgi:branched-chain amino acid transport system substrate-binding protein
MRTGRFLLATATMAALLFVGPAQAQDDKIILGAALCLTGVQAPLDTPGFRGAQVAVKELNDKGGVLGKPVELINVDGKSDPVVVGNAAVEVIEKGADAIIAPCDFDFGGPASREAQEAGLVGISTCASDPLYSSWSLGDKQFTLSMWNTTMGATAADYAFKERGWKTAYVVTDQFIAYTKSLSKYFNERFKTLGGEILLEDTYTNGDMEFSAQLARLKALDRKPDVIFVSSYGQDIGMIIRSLREVGYDAPILGGDSYDDPAMIEALGPKLGNDVYFVTHTWMGPEAHPDMPRFIELYTKMFGEKPDTAFVATGWDVVMMLAKAIEAAGTTEGAALAKAPEQAASGA